MQDKWPICRECGGGMNCQHCRPYQLPVDRNRIAELEAVLRSAVYILANNAVEGDAKAAALAGRINNLLDKWEETMTDDGGRAVARDVIVAQRHHIEELDGLVRAAVAELHIISQIANTDPARVKMLADNAIKFLRHGIEGLPWPA